MVPVDHVCLSLLIFVSHLHGEVIGHIQTHFGSRVNASAIRNMNFIEVSAFSRLKCFAQCASYFKTQHLVFFDGEIERAYDSTGQQQYKKNRLKCAPVSAEAVINSDMPNLGEGNQREPISDKSVSSPADKPMSTLQTQGVPKSDKSVSSPSNKPISTVQTQGGDSDKKVHVKWCQTPKEVLTLGEDTAHVSSSHEAPSKEKEVDVFVRSIYVVATQTSHEKGADTKCSVYLELTGEVASHQLFLNNSGNRMKQGQNDTFQIELRRELEYTRHTDVEVFYSNVDRWLPSLSFYNVVGKSFDDIAYTRLKTYRKDF